MTLEDISQNYKLRERLRQNEEILESLRSKAFPQSPALTGMPSGTDSGDKVGYLAVEIADLETRIEQLQEEIDRAERSATEYIEDIDDDRIRIICRLRFLRCLPWQNVADTMGKYYSARSVRRMALRYLREHE